MFKKYSCFFNVNTLQLNYKMTIGNYTNKLVGCYIHLNFH